MCGFWILKDALYSRKDIAVGASNVRFPMRGFQCGVPIWSSNVGLRVVLKTFMLERHFQGFGIVILL